jgi:photosystem II stability/assembly factor-like uncharacterized protein
MVGTRKGAFIFEAGSERANWKMSGPHFAGWAVQHMVHDPRTGALFAAIYHEVYGANIHRSTDLGATWQMADGPAFMPDAGLTLKRVWRVEPGHASRPKEVWAGADPGALFKSEDGGQTWHSVPGLTNHPTRDKWFPGAGGLMVHSIMPHPTNPDRLYVAISAAGVFRSDDGGQTWAPKNRNTHACFNPEGQQWPEVGQCCHHLVLSSTDPDLLFQQNHCGVYRSEDGGDNWTAIHGGLPSEFGFAIGVLPHKARTIYTVPEISSDYRYTPEGAFTVYRSRDGGDNWEKLSRGLPKTGAFLAVFREGVAVDNCQPGGVYVGTSTGQLFHSRDEGARWQMLADNLPPIYSVTTAVLA